MAKHTEAGPRHSCGVSNMTSHLRGTSHLSWSRHECGLLSVLVELEGVRWHVGRPPPVSWVLPSGVSRKNTGA